MQVRYVLALAALIAVVAATGLTLYARRAEQNGPRRTPSATQTRRGTAAPSMPPALVPDVALIGRSLASGGQPRLIANLADRAGDVVVSVRQIYASDRVRNLFEERVTPGPVGPWQLVLQTNSASTGATSSEVVLDINSVRATDSRGSAMHPIEAPASLNGPAPVPNGRTYTVFMSAPAPQATSIAEIAGVLLGQGGRADARSTPFTIRNVPLPNALRLFGEVTPYELAAPARGRALRSGLLLGDAMEDALRGARMDASSSGLPYLRLILPVGSPTALNAVLPDRAPQITITVQPEPNGTILAEGTIGNIRWRQRLWDREPFLLVVQSKATPGPLGLQLNVSRSNENVILPAARAVFPTQGREAAGSIVVRFRVGSRPIGPGSVAVTLSRFDGTGWSAEETTEAPLRANGEAVIGNLRPGRYRVRFHPERLSPMGAVRGVNITEYLRDRYGLESARWSPEVGQEITVMPGGRSYGATVRAAPELP